MIERKIAKDSWRINLPGEYMEKLEWNKGDSVLLEIKNNSLIITKNDGTIEFIPEEKKINDNKYYPNGKKIPPKKKTPCGLFEFTKQKYADNKCAKCDLQILHSNPGVSCPRAEENTKTVIKEIAENLPNEELSGFVTMMTKLKEKNHESMIKNQEFIKLQAMKERYNELSENSIAFLSNFTGAERNKFLTQIKCKECGNLMKEKGKFIKNGKLVCKNCDEKVSNEIKEIISLRQEIIKLKKRLEEDGRN